MGFAREVILKNEQFVYIRQIIHCFCFFLKKHFSLSKDDNEKQKKDVYNPYTDCNN